MDPQQTPASTPVHNPLDAMQPGERIICEIKRHPIGLVSVFLMSGFVLIAVALISFVAIPSIMSDSGPGLTPVGGGIFILVAALSLLFTFIADRVYWGNRWIVTSDSITQVTRTGLFHSQSSQLSLGNLEDVTAEQNGIFTHIFNYGIIKAETAGERSKFVFTYCPKPNYYAQQILAARERFEQNAHYDTPAQPQPTAPNNLPPAAPPNQPTVPPGAV